MQSPNDLKLQPIDSVLIRLLKKMDEDVTNITGIPKTMGCDIHQYAEYRKNGKWHAELADQANKELDDEDDPDSEYLRMPDSGNRNRNYGLFGLLSEGVRYDTPHAFLPKGEPEEASAEVLTIIAQWQSDGHSHNYLTFAELKEKCAELLLHSDSDAKEYSQMLPAWINSFGPNPEGVSDEDRRVVFFFDN